VLKLNSGSQELRDKWNGEMAVETHTASGAINISRSGIRRLNGATLAMTVATPSVEGAELLITNNAGTAATVTVTDPDADAAANVFTLAAASATVRAALLLVAVNIGTDLAPVLRWASLLGAGTTVA
jgi:hypothetical protein